MANTSLLLMTATMPYISAVPAPFAVPSAFLSPLGQITMVLILSTAALLLLPVLLVSIYRDYARFLSLGPGGTPQTVPGYLRIKLLSLFAVSNPCEPVMIPGPLKRDPFLDHLQKRDGPRPTVRGIAPHRQTDQKGSKEVFNRLKHEILKLAAMAAPDLRLGTSCLEKHGPGLFAVAPVARSNHCSGEVCHAHPSDGSLHLTLHPQDAATVILQGWGERHPLSSGGWLARFVPPGFIIVYAPRNDNELEVVVRIITAAVWWVAGVKVDEKKLGTVDARKDRENVNAERKKQLETRECASFLPTEIDPCS